MVREDIKKILVKAIQSGLYAAEDDRRNRDILYNNNPWNDNLNYIFHLIMSLDGKCGLCCFKFTRSSFSLVAVYDKESKTLFSLMSESNLNTLLHRPIEDSIHYSHSFSQLSKEPCKYEQMKMDNVISADSEKIESINNLLNKLTYEFEYKDKVERYCILQTKINHTESILFDIKAVYINKNYKISEIDNSWNKYISSNYGGLTISDYAVETIENNIDEDEPINALSIKNNLYLKDVKDNNGN